VREREKERERERERERDQHLIAFLSGWAIESTLRIIDSRAVVVPERACRERERERERER
jgi:hypothetical protein